MTTDVTLLRIRVDAANIRAELDEYRRLLGQIRRDQDDLADSARRTRRAYDGLDDVFDGIKGALMGLGVALSGAGFAEFADSALNIRSSLALVSDGMEELTASYEGLKDVSLETNTSFEANVALFSRMKGALEELGASSSQVIDITETIAKSLAVSGASFEEARSSMLQLSQAFGAGVLRGEEFNSVLEGNRRAIQLLADFLDVPVGKMRELAEQGVLTAELMKDAFESQADIIDEEFAQRLQTISGAWENMRTQLTDAVSSFDQATGASGALAGAILGIADNAERLINLGLATAIGLMAGTMGRLIRTVVSLASRFRLLLAANPFTAIGGAILLAAGALTDFIALIGDLVGALGRVANVGVGIWTRINTAVANVNAGIGELVDNSLRYFGIQQQQNSQQQQSLSLWQRYSGFIAETFPTLNAGANKLTGAITETTEALEAQGESVRSMATTWENAMSGTVTATGELAEKLKDNTEAADDTRKAYQEMVKQFLNANSAAKATATNTDSLTQSHAKLAKQVKEFNEQVEFSTVAEKLGLTEAEAAKAAQAAQQHTENVQRTAAMTQDIIDQLTATMGNVFSDLMSGSRDWTETLSGSISSIAASITGTLFGPDGLAGIDLGPVGNKIGASFVGGVLQGLEGLGGVGSIISSTIQGAIIGGQMGGGPGAGIGAGLGLLEGLATHFFGGGGGSGDNTFRIAFGGGGQGGPFGGLFSHQVTDVGAGLNEFLTAMNELDVVFASMATDAEIAKLQQFNEAWTSTTTRMLEGSFELDEALQMVAPRFGAMAAGIENLAPFAADIERAFSSGNVDNIRQTMADIQAFSIAMEQFGLSASEAKDLLSGAQEGSESMLETLDRVYETMFSQEERRAMALEEAQLRVSEFNESLRRTGESAIDTREELREYLQSLDLSRRGGRDAAQAALDYADAIGLVEDASIAATEAAEAEAEARQKQLEAYNEALEQIVSQYVAALTPVLEAMDTDLPTLYADSIADANRTIFETATASADAVLALASAFDGSLEAAQALGAAVDTMTGEMLAAMASAQRARQAVEADIGGLIEYIENAGQEPVRSTSDMLTQIVDEFNNFQTLTDPDQIRESVGQIEEFTRDLWDSLDPNQQGAHRDLFIDFLTEVGNQAQQRIEEAEQTLAEEFTQAVEAAGQTLADNAGLMAGAADGMAAAAAGMNAAAGAMGAAAASIPEDIDVDVSVRVDVVEIG